MKDRRRAAGHVIGIPGQGEGPPMKTWYTITPAPDLPEESGDTSHAMPSPGSWTDDSVEAEIAPLRQSNADFLHELIAKLEQRDMDSQVRILKALWYYFHMDSR